MNLDDICIHSEITKAATLPARFYNDSEVFKLCLERFFARSWQFIGDAGLVRVPGAVHPLILLEGSLNEPVILTRGIDDRLHLLSNVCTHRGNLVCEGPGNERFLRCRYHGRRFGLDGKFVSMPEFEGVEDFPAPADDLAPLKLDRWGPLLFASLDADHLLGEVLADVERRLGWLPLDEFRHAPERGRDYLIRCHWALYVDNYLEGFHVPFIHAALNQTLDYENYACELLEHASLQLAHAKSGEDSFDLPSTSPDYGIQVAAYYYWLFPNTMLNFYPWGLSINVVKPLAPNLTRVSFIPYIWREDRLDRGAGAGLDLVEREDEAVVELVQKGVQSRFYNRGRYSPKREMGTHHFHRLVAERLRKVSSATL